MSFKRLEAAELTGKTAVVRVDFNVPRNEAGDITDDTRIRSALPTINYLQEKGAKIVLLSHFGRPKGQPNPDMSLQFIVPALEAALGKTVTFIEKPSGEMISGLNQDAIVLVENTRFAGMETAGAPKMAQFLASLGDLFVMDAFSASHRNHASSAVIGQYLPSYAGLAMERELDHLAAALDHPKTPVMALVGGAKVSTKIDLLENLVSRLDTLVIGGGMANTFLYAQGHDVGASLCEKDLKAKALDILAAAKAENCDIILPIDVVVATEFKANAESRVCGLDNVAPHEMILDAGPDTVAAILLPSRAAGILLQLSRWLMSWMISHLFRQLAGPSLNGWKAKLCPALKSLKLN